MAESGDLWGRWAALWGSGLREVWEHYLASQDAILDYGRSLVGQTPADTVYTEGRARLLRYRPLEESARRGLPVLCVPSLINRYYVMDLTPERSLVRALLRQGRDVFLLDWGTASEVDRYRPLDDYLEGTLRRAVQAAARLAGQERVSLLGYCMGGMLAVVYTVLHPAEIANLINLAGPVNYHDDGIYSVWTRQAWLDADLLVDTWGNIPAELLNLTYNLVRPTNELVQALNYWERREDETFLRGFAAMQVWLHDPTPFPGEFFRRYIKALYQENQLIRGEFHAAGQRIDLGAITTPALTIAARRDHIAPWQSVAALHDRIASPDRDLIVLESGHIGMVIGASAHADLWPRLGAWLAARS